MLNDSIPFVLMRDGSVMHTPEPVPETVTPSERRELLRTLMADCPACDPDEADSLPDIDVEDMIRSHLGAERSDAEKARA
jgi:hypothetical protein